MFSLLNTLLTTRLAELMHREADNRTSVHLYRVGDYWAAFERSAYQLSRFDSGVMLTPMQLNNFPFPIVMACVHTDEWPRIARHFTVAQSTDDYRHLVTSSVLSPWSYGRWHSREVNDLIGD